MSDVPDSKTSSRAPRGTSPGASLFLPVARPSVPELPAPPPTIGKYRVVGRIGTGAMGVVYKCLQPDLERLVAVKVLLAARHTDAEHLQRFQLEARAAARLAHPNVVAVFDAGTDSGLPYLVMEYVPGPSLDQLIGSPRLTLEVTLRVIYHIAHALHAAHNEGIIHRDVKPSNILIDPAGRPKLADFGLARCIADARLSATGDLIGTPRYMSPEQALAAPEGLDVRTDVYSLGAVMYEMLTGTALVDGTNALAVLRCLTDEEMVPVRKRNPGVPEEVAAICERAVAKDREARFASAAALAEAIQRYMLANWFAKPEVEMLAGLTPLPPPRLPSRRWSVGVAAALLTALLGFAAARWWFPPPKPVVEPQPGPQTPAVDAESVVARSRQELAELPTVADGATYRARLAAVLDDLNVAVKQLPANRDLRLTRARVFRRSGSFLASVDDVNKAFGGGASEGSGQLERLLARYQLELLYLGNLSEPLVRAPASRELRADLAALAQGPDPVTTHLTRLAAALSRGDSSEAVKLAEERPTVVAAEWRADLAMLEADALFHAAGAALVQEKQANDEDRPQARRRREQLAERALRSLRWGLDADPNHVGLLFLKVNSWHLRARWEAGDEDNHDLLRRDRPAFETALNRYRTACVGVGPEAAIGRSVLLFNVGRTDPALDQVKEALALRRDVMPLYGFRAWLQLMGPPEGGLTPVEVERIARDLDPAFETPPEAFNVYFIRALVHTVSGGWDEARRDLQQCRQRLGEDPFPANEENYQRWLQAADGPGVKYLTATGDVCDALAVPVDVRLRLGEEIVKRLTGEGAAGREGVAEEEATTLRGWAHYRVAHCWAEKDARDRVLRHARAALELRVKDLTPQTFRDDGVFKAWENDEEFVKLYAEFAPKPE
jgi:serine/threonine protein kinase/tetratricopeptide (TPR) repeat protein